MRRDKFWPHFTKEGYKKVPCPSCTYIVGDTWLGEKKKKVGICKKCKNVTQIYPPRISKINSFGKIQTGAYYIAEDNSIWTAIPEEVAEKYSY